MASISQDISIQVNSTLNREADFTLLGGTQDPSNGQANAKTLYEWDLSGESLTNCTTVKIEASTVENPTIIEYIVVNQDGDIPNLQVVVNLLNTLNLGTFNLDGNVIFILDDINVFGTLSVLISQDFDIDDFVETGYNYFDSEGKTTLASFSSTYKDSIQHAINTIPTFVETIQTQGWSYVYLAEAKSFSVTRVSAGDITFVRKAGIGTFLSNFVLSGFSNGSVGLATSQPAVLVFVQNINIWDSASISILATDNGSAQSKIYKYVFNFGTTTFNSDTPINRGWQPLSPNYFPSTVGGVHIINVDANNSNILSLYGNSFPSVNNLFFGSAITFQGVKSGSINETFFVGEAGQDAEINFGTIGVGSSTGLSKIESLNGNMNLNFSTLAFTVGSNNLAEIDFKIFFGDSSPQNVTIDSDFNDKFRKTSETDSNADELFLQGTLGGSNFPQLIYDDDTTPLQVNVDEINFRNTYTQNLPPIQVLGGYDGSATVFNLDLDIQNQANPSNISMRYFNDWFFKVGTQDAIYNQNIVSGTRVIDADNNTFILSGSGIQGYQSLFENGYTMNLPVGAIISATISFSIIADPFNTKISGIRMVGSGGQPSFEVTTSEKGQTDSVLSSSFFAINTEILQFPSNNEDVDVIMTTFPPVSTTSIIVGETAYSDQFKRMYIGQGLFQFPLQNLLFTVVGLTLTMPIYDAVAEEVDAIGLYQRNFNGAWGGTNATFRLSQFKINGTNIGNPSIQPFNSGAIINLTSYTSNFPNIDFQNCEFGTDLVDNTLNNILNLLLPSSAFASGGIFFQNCTFNGVDSLNPYLQVTFPLGSLNVSSQALNGTSRISNTIFSQSQPDRILFTSNWDGNPTASPLNLLLVSFNTNLEQINLQNSNTATPNALTLNIINNSALEVLNFTNHNVTNLLFSNNDLINNIDLSGNNLPDAEIDDLLNEVNSYGTSNGTINYSSQTGGGVPTAIGSGTAYNNLISRGWTLIGTSPFGINVTTYTVNQTQAFARPTVYDWEFNEAGDLLFIFAGANFEKYPLTTPFDISTIGAISQSVAWNSSPSFFGTGSQVWDNGNYLFMGISGLLRRWTFGTANDLTTISSFATVVQSPNVGFDYNFTFNPSGTKVYSIGVDEIDEFTLSTAWNPTTLTSSGTKTYASMGLTSIPIGSAQRRISLRFNSSGTLAILTFGTSASPFDALAYEMNLSIAFDITTMSYSGNSLDISDKPNEWVNKVGADSNLTKIIPLYLQTGGYPTNSTDLKEWS